MLGRSSVSQPVVRICQNFCSMASVVASKDKESTERGLLVENMTKRSKKKMRRFQHQQRIEKKTAPDDNLQQLPSYCEENINETDYYHQNGLRKVYPYYFSFSTYAKGRWMGRTILDVFSKEFQSQSPEYYKENIEEGRVTVNSEKVTPDFILGNNHLIMHTCHRHENPIKHVDLEILVDNDEVLVVNKPSSWPIHPCGRYRYNSLTLILQKQYGYKNLRGLYRLDRLTSGVFIMAKTAETAAKIFKDIGCRKVQKEYVARVVGRFPDGTIECKESLSCISYKLSIYRTDPKGKESSTTFERLSFNGKTSVVKCMPHTGRTHQIRVHLQYLGHPIVNDSLYNCEAFGPSRGKGGIGDDANTQDLEKEILKHHNVGMFTDSQENLLYKRKLATVKERKLESNKKSENTLSCPASTETVKTCPAASQTDQNVLSEKAETVHLIQDTVKATECEPHALVQDMTEEAENSSLTDNENSKKVSRELYDFTETSEDIVRDISDGPPEKRVKISEVGFKVTGEETSLSDSNNSAVTNDVERNATELESNLNRKEDCSQTFSELGERTRVDCKNVDNNSDQIIEGCDTDRTNKTSGLGASCLDLGSEDAESGKPKDAIVEEYNEERMYELLDVCCKDCQTTYIDPTEADLVMYLHAYRYKGSDWEYSTPLPDWAQEDWQEP